MLIASFGLLSLAGAFSEKVEKIAGDPAAAIYSVVSGWHTGASFEELETLGIIYTPLKSAWENCQKAKHTACEMLGSYLTRSEYVSSEQRRHVEFKVQVRGYSQKELARMKFVKEFSNSFSVTTGESDTRLYAQCSLFSSLQSAVMDCHSAGCDHCMLKSIVQDSAGSLKASATVIGYKNKTSEELILEKFPELNELPELPSLVPEEFKK